MAGIADHRPDHPPVTGGPTPTLRWYRVLPRATNGMWVCCAAALIVTALAVAGLQPLSLAVAYAAMLVVAGKFDVEKTLKQINEKYGNIPRPTRVLEKTPQGVVTKDVQFKYDVFDRRIEKKLVGAGNPGLHRWLYDGEHIALEFNGANQLTHRYLHGPVVDQIFADEHLAAPDRERVAKRRVEDGGGLPDTGRRRREEALPRLERAKRRVLE